MSAADAPLSDGQAEKRLRNNNRTGGKIMAGNRILIVDFGGQYNQLIARRVRECGVYSEIRNFDDVDAAVVKDFDPKGIIFTRSKPQV